MSDRKGQRPADDLLDWFTVSYRSIFLVVGALLVSGFAQAFVERAIGGSTHAAFIAGQENRWFVEGMVTRFIFGLIFTAGYVALVYDFLTLGRRAHVVAAGAAAE